MKLVANLPVWSGFAVIVFLDPGGGTTAPPAYPDAPRGAG
jgi:hypothetical protein